MVTADPRTHDDAVAAAVTAYMAANSYSILVGDGRKPDGVAAGAGWIVVHPIAGGTVDGPVSSDDDATLLYQVTAWGHTREQARGVAALVRAALLDTYQPVMITGRSVIRLTLDADGGAIREDDTGEPPLWMVPDTYRLVTTPN